MGFFGFLGDVINLLGAVASSQKVENADSKMDKVQNIIVDGSKNAQRNINSAARTLSDDQLRQAANSAPEKYGRMAAEREIERRNNR